MSAKREQVHLLPYSLGKVDGDQGRDQERATNGKARKEKEKGNVC